MPVSVLAFPATLYDLLPEHQVDHQRMLLWAEHRVEEVKKDVEAFIGKYPYRVWSKNDMKQSSAEVLEGVFTVRAWHPIEPMPDEIILRTGDVLHSFRVALDYLAVAAVLKASPTVDESKIAFPICDDPSKFRSLAGLRLPGATPEIVNAIEQAQPYSGPGSLNDHPLWLLDKLEQPHKHRRLLSAYLSVNSFVPEIKEGREEDVVWLHQTIPPGPLENEHEIARCRIARDTNGQPKAKVEGKTRFSVSFDKSGPARGIPVIRLLNQISDHIRNVIFPVFKDLV